MDQPKFTKEQIQEAIIRVTCMALLHEKKEQGALRAAFASSVQERHEEFHDKTKKSSFQECGNIKCKDATQLIHTYADPAIEYSLLTAEMLEQTYTISILRGGKHVIVSLKDKNKIDEPPTIPPQEGEVIIKI